MVSLVDIVPQTRTVQIAAGEITLHGLGLRQIADLLLRYPNLHRVFAGGDIEPAAMLVVAPDAIGGIIAEAAGQPEAAESIADRLPIDDVIECLLVVRDLTLPNGAAPFFERLAKMLRDAGGQSGKAPDMTSPPLPNGSLAADTALAT